MSAAQTRLLVAACREAGALSFVNDRVDVALAADADGAHVGQVHCVSRGQGLGVVGLLAAAATLTAHAPGVPQTAADVLQVCAQNLPSCSLSWVSKALREAGS